LGLEVAAVESDASKRYNPGDWINPGGGVLR